MKFTVLTAALLLSVPVMAATQSNTGLYDSTRSNTGTITGGSLNKYMPPANLICDYKTEKLHFDHGNNKDRIEGDEHWDCVEDRTKKQ